jgi:glutamine synthetase
MARYLYLLAAMKLEELREEVANGSIDTVVLAITDMQGRLMGKRLVARYFADEVAEHGAEGCNYLLAVDVDMTPVEGFAMASWERGWRASAGTELEFIVFRDSYEQADRKSVV